MKDRGTGVETAVQDQELGASLVWALEGRTRGTFTSHSVQCWLLQHAWPSSKRGQQEVNSERKPTKIARNTVSLLLDKNTSPHV